MAIALRSAHLSVPRLAVLSLVLGSVGAGCAPEESAFSALEGTLIVTPSEIELSPVWAGIGATAELTLENRGAAPIDDLVLSVGDAAGEGVWTATLLGRAIAPGARVTALVQLAVEEGVVGTASATIAITSALDGQVEVAARASVLPAPSCDDGNPCTQDRFSRVEGLCTHELLEDGAVCEDGSACTTDDRCLMGRCTGAALTCDDEVECTADGCDADVGCVFTPVAERCDDEDPCTEDVCVVGDGCQNPPLEEGALCHFDGCTEIGLCFAGFCQLHPTPDGVPCEDGDSCTVADVCIEGQCRSGAETAVAPGVPVEVRPGSYWADLCAGPEDLAWNCYADAEVIAMEEVLAVARFPEGFGLVWRGPFVNDFGGSCEPSQPLYQPIAIDTPDDRVMPPPPEEDGDGVEPDLGAEAPSTDICASPVFLTLTSFTGELQLNLQLTAVRGPAAAAIQHPEVDLLSGGTLGPAITVAASVFAGDRVVVETYDRAGGVYAQPRYTDQLPFVPLGDRVGGVAVAVDTVSALVIAHGSQRLNATGDSDSCFDAGCISTLALGATRMPFDPELPLINDTLHLAMRDGLCADPVYLPGPLTVRDLHAAITDGAAITTFRASASDCVDFDVQPIAPDLPPTEVYGDTVWRVEFEPGMSDGFEIYSPLPGFAPGTPDVVALSLGSQGDVSAAIWRVPDPAASCTQGAAADPVAPEPPCPAVDGSEHWSVGLGAGPGAMLPWLSGPGAGQDQAVTALVLDGEPSIALLSGGALHLLRRAADTGDVVQLPGLQPADSSWRADLGLLAASDGSGLVAGHALANEQPPGVSREHALVQGFRCGAGSGSNQVACQGDAACGEAEFCQTEGVCLAPPDCQGGCEPVCWGVCTPEAPPDAGPADAGAGDAGTSDAGSADAGASDAGAVDAGTGTDGGLDTDAGTSSDAGPAGDAG